MSSAFAKGGALNFIAPESVATGNGHACALAEGKVYCWGRNDHGQTDVPLLNKPKMVATGEDHTCALDADGVKCWGDNRFGQLNVPPLSKPEAVYAGTWITCVIDDGWPRCWGHTNFPKLIHRPKILAPGETHVCLLDDEGVKCWGEKAEEKWEQVPPLKNVQALVSGNGFSCALADGGVTCWRKDGAAPMDVPTLNQPRALAAHDGHVCAVDADGVKCWGSNEFGESNVPKLTNAHAVTTGGNHACAIADEGVVCWGSNLSGESAPPALGNVTEVSASHDHTCATAGDRITCWGKNSAKRGSHYNEEAARGDARNVHHLISNGKKTCYDYDYQTYKTDPVTHQNFCEYEGGGSGGGHAELFQGSALSDRYSCHIYDGKDASCYLLQGNQSGSFPFPPSYKINRMAIGSYQICTVVGAVVKCWDGYRFSNGWEMPSTGGGFFDGRPRAVEASVGGLGLCVRTSKDAVVCQRSGDTAVVLRAAEGLGVGDKHGCAAVSGGGVHCWGDNRFGQTDAPAIGVVNSLKTAGNYNCAVDGNGLHCWGENKSGQLDFPLFLMSGRATFEDPRFNLNQLGSFLAVARKVSTDARARVYAGAMDFLAKQPKDASREASVARYLTVVLLRPVLESSDSTYAQSTLLPAFRESMAGFRQALGIADEHRVAASAANRLVAFTLLQISVGVAEDFLAPAERSELQAASRLIGQAVAEPGDSTRARAVAEAVNGASPTLEKLARNNKSAFLVEIIHQTADWLRNAK